MVSLTFEMLDIKDSYIITSFCSEDNRGCFIKPFEKKIFKDNGIEFECSESFISCSRKYVIRGMHFQTYHPQIKLVGVIKGIVFDVIVDLRKESKTFGQWRGYYLSEENRTSLLIPRGCAHGFISLSDESVVNYLCDGEYDRETDSGILYNDPVVNVKWPIKDLSQAIVSERDLMLKSFDEFIIHNNFIY